VFEIAKTAHGYASTPSTLVSFNGTNGTFPEGSLLADAHGNLFGTATGGGNGDGTVFEIAKTAHGYASSPTTLVNFNGANGDGPDGSLIADAHGNLFGTTAVGGSNGGYGTVFEIVKTDSGYASSPTTLVSFNGTDGIFPHNVIADPHGDLFGTTNQGGVNGSGYRGLGTVFEIAKTATGYASTPTTLVNFNDFNGTKGAFPLEQRPEVGRTATARCSRSPAAASVPIRRLAVRYLSRTTISCSTQNLAKTRGSIPTCTTRQLIILSRSSPSWPN
jgi:hypothetical protein